MTRPEKVLLPDATRLRRPLELTSYHPSHPTTGNHSSLRKLFVMVIVYTTKTCFPCKLTVNRLIDLGIAHETRDVSTDPTALEFVKSLGYSAAPVVVAPDGSHWQGLDPDKIKALAK